MGRFAHIMKARSLAISAAVVIGTFSLAVPAMAQEAAESQRASERGKIETIITTSTKRAQAQAAQTVPVAGTFLTADMISLNQYNDFLEIARMVPNANFRETNTFPGVQRFWLRGVGVTFSVPNFDPVIGVISDGVYIAQNIAAILDTFDMESVEVLRGPQGTLFGRNMAGGAVLARTRRPGTDEDVRAIGKFIYGKHNRIDAAFSVSAPIVRDKFAAKLAVQYRDREGWINNLYEGGKPIGDVRTLHIKPILVFTPSENLDITILGEYFQRRGDGAVAMSFPPGPNLEGITNPLLPEGGRAWNETWIEQDRLPSHSDHDNWRLTAEINYDMGHGTLTSITGYMEVDALSGADFDGLPPPVMVSETRIYIASEQFSQELRYASDFSDKFDFTVGLYYFEQDLFYGEQRLQGSRIGRDIQGVQLPGNPDGLGAPGHSRLDHKNFAAFLETHTKLTDQLTLTVGGRYSVEKKEAWVGFVNGTSCVSSGYAFMGLKEFECLYGPADGFDFTDKETWKNFAPKIVLDYQVNDDVLLYASWAVGHRSGGWSFRASVRDLLRDRPGFYDRERVSSYELGVKADWADDRLRTNLAVFYSDWKDIQRNLQVGVEGGDIFQFTLNAEKSWVWGIEFETNAILATDFLTSGDSLRFDGSLGWIDSGYDSFVDFDGDQIDDGPDAIFDSPDLTAYLGLTYEHPVGNGGGYMTWRVSYNYTSQYWTDPKQLNNLAHYSSKDIMDLFVRFDSGDDRWHASFFVKNALNDQFYESRVTFVANSFGVALPGMPRTWGIELGVDL